MSKWLVLDSSGLHDPATGVPYGMLGADGKEYSFPALVAAQSGTFAQMLALTGMSDGDSFYVTSGAGNGKSWWTYNATTGLWTPVGGTLVLAQMAGTAKASPLATVTKPDTSTNQKFTLPSTIAVQANVLRQGCRVDFEALVERTVGTGAAVFMVRLGTAGTGGDKPMDSITIGTTVGNTYNPRLTASIESTSIHIGYGGTNPASAGVAAEQTGGNFAADNQITCWITGTGGIGDTFVIHNLRAVVNYGV